MGPGSRGWGCGGLPSWLGMTLLPVTHTLGKVPVGGGGPGFPSPWQPKQTNNTAGRVLGAGWPPTQPSFPLACPGSWRLEEGELGPLLLPLPWGGVAGGGPGCRKLWQTHFSLEVPRTDRNPRHPRRHHRCLARSRASACSFPAPPFMCRGSLCLAPPLSLVPLPQGPGPAAPPSPLPPLLWGQRFLSLLGPERPPWCPQ